MRSNTEQGVSLTLGSSYPLSYCLFLLIYLGGQWLQFVSEGWVLVRAISYKAKKSFALYKMRNFKL